MNTLLCMSLMTFVQTSPQPPAQGAPGKTGGNQFISPQQQQRLQNGQVPPATQQNVPGNPVNGTGNQSFISPQQQQQLQNGQLPPGSFGSMYQMPVDGSYQVLAYEKFGQVLPGMNTLRVVIRNNILIFPGDGRTPGKMLQMAFGPGNTIMLTPFDNRQDPTQNTTTGNTTGTGNTTVNTNSPAGANLPGGGQPSVAGRNNTNNNASGSAGVGTNVGQGNMPIQGGNNNTSGIIQPTSQSEVGVYVLSNEYFSISVTGRPATNDPTQAGTVSNQTPGNGQTTVNGLPPGSDPNNAIRNTVGSLPPIGTRAGGNMAPGRTGVTGTPGGAGASQGTGIAPVAGTNQGTGVNPGTGTNQGTPSTNPTQPGINQTLPGNPNNTQLPGSTQVPGNGVGQQQPTSTTPPGSPNQAVLVLRRVSN